MTILPFPRRFRIVEGTRAEPLTDDEAVALLARISCAEARKTEIMELRRIGRITDEQAEVLIRYAFNLAGA